MSGMTFFCERRMTMDEYEEFTGTTAKYPRTSAMEYTALGLCGEAGEYAEKVKKGIRDGSFDREGAILELGDVLFYLTRAAVELGVSLEEVADRNIVKLTSRNARGVIGGSGDAR